MKTNPKIRTASQTLLLIATCTLFALPLIAQTPVSIPEKIEWTWEVRPPQPDPKLPNVLLLGDSITRAYFPGVVTRLTGKANVYLFATSAAVGDPRLPHQIAEFIKMEAVPFRVIHFNNGMHGWDYTEAQYKAAFPSLVKELRADAPHASLIWATTTPVRAATEGGATNPRVDARNAIAKAAIAPHGIPTDDQHELMLHHGDQHQDDVHFNPQGADEEAAQAASTIEVALAK
jgi:GDSL-like Lipase/Acylhydrolase family